MAVNMQTTVDFDELPMDRLRERYLEQGFEFIANPGVQDLPAFFGSYRPDAVAIKPGLNVAIQFMRARHHGNSFSLDEVRRLFVDLPEWRFVISHGGEDPLMLEALPAVSETSIRSQLQELRDLGRKGQMRAAFVLGWSLLEAVLNHLEDNGNRRPRKPGTVLESLARLGYLSPEREAALRPLALLRNRIVHGDIHAQPSPSELDALFDAIEEALA